MQISDYLKNVKAGKISAVDIALKILKEAKKANKDYNFFTSFSEELALQQAEAIEKKQKLGQKLGKLAGLPVSIKDCICVKDTEASAGSEILKGYRPIFNATAVQKLINEDAIIIGKTSQDEFGFGGFSTNTNLPPKNPLDKTRVCGGSSGGAAGFTAYTDFPHIAIAESTGGSIVNPASFCGVVGLCPTYGLVSRYGLISYADSLDKIGIIGKSTDDTKLAIDVIAGNDIKDSTSLRAEIKPAQRIKKIGLIKGSLNVDKKIKDIILKKVDQLSREYKIEIEQVSLPTTIKYGTQCYYLIAMSEASTNLARYCGIKYGREDNIEGDFDRYFTHIRSKYFGKEAKRRIILGTFARMAGFRNKYYLKAMQVRSLILKEYKNAFKGVDVLVSPTMPVIAPKFVDVNKLTPVENYMMDILTVGPNLVGMPHISLNAGLVDKMPVGIMFTADHLEENRLLEIGKISN